MSETNIPPKSFVEKVEIDFNLMRVNPASFIKHYKNAKFTLERVKGKSYFMVKDLEQLINFLGKAPSLPKFNVSNSLIKIAEKRLDYIEVLGQYEAIEQPALSEYGLRYGKDFTKIYELEDEGSVETEEVLFRFMSNENDPERKNRSIIFDSEIQFFGIGHRVINEKNITVIIFADKFTELPEESMNTQLLNRFNKIRSNPTSYLNDFEMAQKIYQRITKSTFWADENQLLINQITNEKPKPELIESQLLSNIARLYINSISLVCRFSLLDAHELTKLCRQLFGGFSYVVGCGIHNIFDPDKILEKTLLNEEDTQNFFRKGLFNEDTKYIGVHHEVIGYVPITIVVLSDNVCSLEDEVAIEFNKIVNTPAEMNDTLSKYRKSLEKSSKNKGQIEYIDDLIKQFEKGLTIPDFKNSTSLCKAAEEYLKLNKKASVFDHRFYREEKEFLSERLKHYCTGYTKVYQFVECGGQTLKETIFNLLVDPRDEFHEFRAAIWEGKLNYFGIAKGVYQNKPLTSIVLVDNVEEIPNKVFIESFLEEINHLRFNPKSFIKLYEDFLDKIPETNEAEKDAVNKMTKFLKSTRFYGPLQRSDFLDRAAEARIQFLKKENKHLKKPSLEDSKIFLSDFCSGFLFVAEVTSKSFDNSHDLILNRLVQDDFQNGFKSYIFSSKHYYIGLAYDEKTKLFVAFFADAVEDLKENSTIPIETKRKRVNRPDLTDDEDLQIRKDFHKLDNLNKGVIMPQHIYTFLLKVPNMEKKNPIYFNAIKNNIDNLHFQQYGMTVDDFVEECKKAIDSLDKSYWKNVYSSMLNDPKSKNLDYKSFRNLTKNLGLRLSDQECREIILKISDENGKIDYEKFQTLIDFENQKR